MAIFQKLYRIETEQFIPISLNEAWDFFSSPNNLKEITPDHMGFKITSKSNEKMYPGMLITYIVTPLLGIGMRWCTEITHVKNKSYFIDQQRFGPYNMWHHQHHFEEVEGGVMMRDIVNYGIPLGILGQIANSIMVKSQLKEIFEYRVQAVEKLWPVVESTTSSTVKFY
ncbi:MAG: ligand-binding SRPBCC domain-containing protein [Saprospiraceae bacterium]|jgi:ligand-binding SRPBCC domain-containing protein|tara:strand:- start:175 stop:681 length:507 start_codon:yes stop_codon:yes gene_type:complete